MFIFQLHSTMGISQSKKTNDIDDDDDDHPNTIVLANKLDTFTFDQVYCTN